MTGWTLPPGVTTSMLPGNEQRDDALENALYVFIGQTLEGNPVTLPLEIDEEFVEKLTEWVEDRVRNHGAQCFAAGMREAEAARQQREVEAVAAGRFAFMRLLDGSWHVCARNDPGHVLFIPELTGER